jgi:hypothetical protein
MTRERRDDYGAMEDVGSGAYWMLNVHAGEDGLSAPAASTAVTFQK